MNINNARFNLLHILNKFSDQLTHDEKESLSLADSALKTIRDMENNNNIPPTFDMKTLYEQITMYAKEVSHFEYYDYKIERYQYPNTPIQILIVWEYNKIISIQFKK